jgi:hypothetical protein
MTKHLGSKLALILLVAWSATFLTACPDEETESNCADGVDNDNDLDVDCDDSDCSEAVVCQPEDCSDGVDNDGNFDVDCEDAACVGTMECLETCDDGEDNDLDRDIDCEDSDCDGDPACIENCEDGVDNDGDGDIDCDDVECIGEPECIEDCDDGVDNDGDGAIDCRDTDCTGDPACVEVCDDGIDNDSDGDVDCADSNCAGDPVCVEICDDGIDNDGDGDIDCGDSDCEGDPDCLEICDDGIDNDLDNDIDCDDVDCAGDPACVDRSEICDDLIDNDGDGAVDCIDSDCSDLPVCDDDPGNTPDDAMELPADNMGDIGPIEGDSGPDDPDFFRFELCKDGAVVVILGGDGARAELRDSDGTTVLRTSAADDNGVQVIRYYGGLNPARTLFLVILADEAETQYDFSIGLVCPQNGDDVFDTMGTGEDGNNQRPVDASPLEQGPEAFESSLEAVLLDPEETPGRDRDNYGVAVCGGGRISVRATYEPAVGEIELAIHALDGEGGLRGAQDRPFGGPGRAGSQLSGAPPPGGAAFCGGGALAGPARSVAVRSEHHA